MEIVHEYSEVASRNLSDDLRQAPASKGLLGARGPLVSRLYAHLSLPVGNERDANSSASRGRTLKGIRASLLFNHLIRRAHPIQHFRPEIVAHPYCRAVDVDKILTENPSHQDRLSRLRRSRERNDHFRNGKGVLNAPFEIVLASLDIVECRNVIRRQYIDGLDVAHEPFPFPKRLLSFQRPDLGTAVPGFAGLSVTADYSKAASTSPIRSLFGAK